jgi:hypothetical protein
MNITRLTHITQNVLRADFRFDTNVITGGNQPINYKVYLTGQSRLKTARITGLQVVTNAYMADSNVISSAQAAQYVITLADKEGKPFLDNYPLYDLCFESNYGKIRRLNCQIDPDQSFIRLLDTSVGSRASTDIIPVFFWYSFK